MDTDANNPVQKSAKKYNIDFLVIITYYTNASRLPKIASFTCNFGIPNEKNDERIRALINQISAMAAITQIFIEIKERPRGNAHQQVTFQQITDSPLSKAFMAAVTEHTKKNKITVKKSDIKMNVLLEDDDDNEHIKATVLQFLQDNGVCMGNCYEECMNVCKCNKSAGSSSSSSNATYQSLATSAPYPTSGGPSNILSDVDELCLPEINKHEIFIKVTTGTGSENEPHTLVISSPKAVITTIDGAEVANEAWSALELLVNRNYHGKVIISSDLNFETEEFKNQFAKRLQYMLYTRVRCIELSL